MFRSSMKMTNMHLKFEDDTAHAFNQDIDLTVTNSGRTNHPKADATQV